MSLAVGCLSLLVHVLCWGGGNYSSTGAVTNTLDSPLLAHQEVDSKFLDKTPSECRPLKWPHCLLGSPHGMAESGHSLDTDSVPDSVYVYCGSWPEGISLRIPDAPLTFPMDHFHKARNSTNGLTVSRALPGHTLSTISTIPPWSAQSQGLMALCDSGSSDLANFSPHLGLLLGEAGGA